MNKRTIELFTAGCLVCNPVVEMVTSIANKEYNEITVYDLVKQWETKECVTKVKDYGIKRLPSIAIDGKLMECCKSHAITKEDLINGGIMEKL